jgi:transcriptional regulator
MGKKWTRITFALKQKIPSTLNPELPCDIGTAFLQILLSRHQNAGQSYDIKIANRCFEIVTKFRYLGTTIINQNPIQDEIKRRLNSDNAVEVQMYLKYWCKKLTSQGVLF